MTLIPPAGSQALKVKELRQYGEYRTRWLVVEVSGRL